jgi:glyceraldehyde 3-phosphate dehydrogenase
MYNGGMSKKLRVAINGFGRIGRLAARNILLKYPEVQIVAVNDITSVENLAYLLKFDSTYRQLECEVLAKDQKLFVTTSANETQEILVFAQKDPSQLPWKDLEIDVVLECTGLFLTTELAQNHIHAGAKKVILSAPAKSGDIPTVVLGVSSEEELQHIFSQFSIISNASCTTNCAAPALKVLTDNFIMKSAFGVTIHAYTATQPLQDGPTKKHFRDGRAGAVNIIPSSTGAASAVAKVLPILENKLSLSSVRVPVITGSMVYLTVQVDTSQPIIGGLSVEYVNKMFLDSATGALAGILEYSQAELVSTDIIQNPHSVIFDAQSTEVLGDTIKVVLWYDNEWGYANRLVELMQLCCK